MSSTTSGWTIGRVLTLLTGGAVALIGITVLGFGAVAVGAALDDSPYTRFGESATFRSDGYAVTSDPWTSDYILPGTETIRLEITPDEQGDERIFAGFARAADAESYLTDVRHTALHAGYTEREQIDGAAPSGPPTDADIWVSTVEGSGTQNLDLDPAELDESGLMPVVMNADASGPVNAHVEIAYRIPGLGGFAAGMLIGGALVTAGGVLLIVRPIRRARRTR